MTDAIDRTAMAAELERDEGRREQLYRCAAGKLTIGVGWNIEDRGLPAPIIDALLGYTIDDAIRDLNRELPWWQKLNERRKRALVNMTVNLGMPRLRQFRNMLACLQVEDYEGAAREALDSRWANQVGDRARRIAAMIREG